LLRKPKEEAITHGTFTVIAWGDKIKVPVTEKVVLPRRERERAYLPNNFNTAEGRDVNARDREDVSKKKMAKRCRQHAPRHENRRRHDFKMSRDQDSNSRRWPAVGARNAGTRDDFGRGKAAPPASSVLGVPMFLYKPANRAAEARGA
jgi:hypothetical protein